MLARAKRVVAYGDMNELVGANVDEFDDVCGGKEYGEKDTKMEIRLDFVHVCD